MKRNMNKKYFIITIDTEGDNQWKWKPGDSISTNNVDYLDRFQELCNKFSFKPVWLTNYEIINNDRFVEFVINVETSATGELGMHLHAWNTPPYYELPRINDSAPYLIEYPPDIMEAKIVTMTDAIINRTGFIPTTHRAGRWAMNERYFELILKHGYCTDCSLTPHIDWSNASGQSQNSKGTNYTSASEKAYSINGILEVPMSIRMSHHFFKPGISSIRKYLGAAYHSIKGKPVWMRPNGNNYDELVWLSKRIKYSNSDYLMFMLHSSELMPGGSPTFQSKESIEKLYEQMEALFTMLSKMYKGITLRDYSNLVRNQM